jgi:hypothetical protein
MPPSRRPLNSTLTHTGRLGSVSMGRRTELRKRADWAKMSETTQSKRSVYDAPHFFFAVPDGTH